MEGEKNDTPWRQKPPPPGTRPASLAEPRGDVVQVQRHTAEQLADGAPRLPTLDVPVPQIVDQLVAVLARFDALLQCPRFRGHPASHVQFFAHRRWRNSFLKCRGSSISSSKKRTFLAVLGVVLVEVNKVFFQDRVSHQTVDNPVPRRGFSGTSEGLQGLHPGQGSPLRVVEQSVYSHGVSRGPQGFLLEQGSTAMVAEQGSLQRAAEHITDIPVSRTRDAGRHHVFSSGQGSHAFDGADHRVRRSFHPREGSTAFRGPERHDDGDFLPGQGSRARSGARVRGGGDQGSVPRQGSTTVRGALRLGLRVVVGGSRPKLNGLTGTLVEEERARDVEARPWTCTSTKPSSGLEEGVRGLASPHHILGAMVVVALVVDCGSGTFYLLVWIQFALFNLLLLRPKMPASC